jgi:hypothetical protein
MVVRRETAEDMDIGRETRWPELFLDEAIRRSFGLDEQLKYPAHENLSFWARLG